MSSCGREFHIACMRNKSSSFEAAGRGSRARCRPTKSHTCSIGDNNPPNKQAKEEVACVKAEQKSRTVFATCNMWECIILQKDSSRDALKKGRKRLPAVPLHGRTCCY
ncbi:hypothetical protein TNCV_3059651 [Trichonephila clavipes]|nr:hypothetical protein TNCV_3059651 [Trichonephila clavipes]